MSKSMTERLREYLESEEGKQSLREWAEELKRDSEHKQRWLDKFHALNKEERLSIIDKYHIKYASKEYNERWKKRGYYEAPEPFFFFVMDYAREYGTEMDLDDDDGMFASGAMVFDDGIKAVIYHGQGSFVRIHYKM